MKQIIIKNGLLAGLIVSTFMVCSMAYLYNTEGAEGSMLVGYASMLAAFSFVFLGIKKYRDKECGGTITFFTAFKIGIAISAIASIMYTLSWAIEYHFFIPDFMDKYIATATEKLQKSNLNAEELKSKIAELNAGKAWYANIFMFLAITFTEIFPIGLLVTIISALILKKK